MPEEVSAAKMYGAEGVGLFRTELLFLSSRELPGEEEQYQSYRKLVESLSPATATIRTIDIGGDKLIPNYPGGNEANPAMGLRAIRFSMKEIDLFRVQLRAILRASAHGRARILFPMISGVEEVRKAKTLVRSVMDDLRREGVSFHEGIEIGVMIEVPSASITADILAREVDFFSIGTNDLIQYALAIDRVNEHVSYLYEPLHPAVLRIIRDVVQAGRQAGIPVALCGEIAAEPAYALILLGLGLEDLSMTPVSIPKVKKILRMARFEETRAMVDELFRFSTAAEISGHVRRWMAERFPEDVLDLFHDAGEPGRA
jgi:phosphotransferase system enzyme I (PtsI)